MVGVSLVLARQEGKMEILEVRLRGEEKVTVIAKRMSKYDHNVRYCSRCAIYLVFEGPSWVRCPLCGTRLRASPRKKTRKKDWRKRVEEA